MKSSITFGAVLGLSAYSLGMLSMAQTNVTPATSLENVSGCSLEGTEVFISTGQGSEMRRYKYPWDASIDILCNSKGFAIVTPKGMGSTTVEPTKAATIVPAPVIPSVASLGFPSDAVALSPVDLHETLASKVYGVKLADGTTWRWQFRADGYFFFNSGGFSDTGKWNIKGSALCSEGRRITASCNEVRRRGAELLLKRDNGEIITMVAQ